CPTACSTCLRFSAFPSYVAGGSMAMLATGYWARSGAVHERSPGAVFVFAACTGASETASSSDAIGMVRVRRMTTTSGGGGAGFSLSRHGIEWRAQEDLNPQPSDP